MIALSLLRKTLPAAALLLAPAFDTFHAQGAAMIAPPPPMPTVPQVAGIPAAATQAAASIDPERIRAHVRFLASDLLEGRGPGKRGAELAAEYIATEFALDGLKPAGDNGTFFQNVPLYAVHTDEAQTTASFFRPPERRCRSPMVRTS